MASILDMVTGQFNFSWLSRYAEQCYYSYDSVIGISSHISSQ